MSEISLHFANLYKIFSPQQDNSIRVSSVIPKINLGNKDFLRIGFLKPIINGVHSLKQFLLFAACFWLTSQRLSWCSHSIPNFCPLCKELTPFCKTRIIGTKRLGTFQCVLSQCKVSFDDVGKF